MTTIHPIQLAEQGLLPEFLIRMGIRKLLAERLRGEYARLRLAKAELIEDLRKSQLAVDTDKANEQHYEVPTAFFKEILGRRMKYSCCYWPEGVNTLDEAEEASLQQVAQRACLESGQRVLELGCGWGSFSLWAAEQYPKSEYVAVSNSHSQRRYIEEQARLRGLENLTVITADINAFEPEGRFDRIVSIEMFEHVRNYASLLERIADWLTAEGRLFVHVFAHKEVAYTFEDKQTSHWMARHFFSGGIMPSVDLFSHFGEHMEIEEQWRLDGTHYQRTLESWLDLLKLRREEVFPILQSCYGDEDAGLWYRRWMLFMMAGAELFGYQDGQQWGVSHYLMRKR